MGCTVTPSGQLRHLADALEGVPHIRASAAPGEASVHLHLADFRERFAGREVEAIPIAGGTKYTIVDDGIRWSAYEVTLPAATRTVTL
jgi:hypothetical protein